MASDDELAALTARARARQRRILGLAGSALVPIGIAIAVLANISTGDRDSRLQLTAFGALAILGGLFAARALFKAPEPPATSSAPKPRRPRR